MKIKYFIFPNLKLPFESLFEEKMHCKKSLQKYPTICMIDI